MKKSSVWKKACLASAAAALVASFIGCANPANNDAAGGDAAAEPVYKEIFDPTATDTYEIRKTKVDAEGNAIKDADGNETYDVLVKDTDYTITDGNLVITPDSWYTNIVLKTEVDATGAEVTCASLNVDATGKAKMGFNLISSAEKENYSGEIAVEPSTKYKEYKGTFGKKYTGNDWSTTPVTTYKGAEKVIKIQPYVQGGASDGWNATSNVKITLGKIVVYNDAGLKKHNEEAGTPEPVVSDVLDEIKMSYQETAGWSGGSTESVEIKKGTTEVVFEATGLSLKVIDETAGNKNATNGVLNLYVQTVDGTTTQWTAQDSCIYKVKSVEVMVNDETAYKTLTLDEDLADAEGPLAKGLEEDTDDDKKPLGTFHTKISLANPWWHDCVSGFAAEDVLKAVKVTLTVAVK